MANHKSALKRARQSRVRRQRNMVYKTKAKNAVKEVRASLADNNADNTKENLNRAMSVLQKTVARGVLHKNTAARRISRLARQANRLP